MNEPTVKARPRRQKATGANVYQIGQAGPYFVAAELNRQGAYAVTVHGSRPTIDILATNAIQTRQVSIQVKTRGAGTWQTSIEEGLRRSNKNHFWVFVDLSDATGPPSYYIVPDAWIRDNIKKTHEAYLARHRGARPVSPRAKHHSIDAHRIARWKDRWDILKLF